MSEIIQNRKRLTNKLQIVAVAPCKEIDGKSAKSFQCLPWDAAKCKPGIGKSKKLNNLPGNNAHPNGRENPNLGFGVRDSGLDLRNGLITSWGRNKPPPPRKKLFFGFVILNY